MENNNEKKKLDFWNDNGDLIQKESAFAASFPEGKLATSKQMEQLTDTLIRRMGIFKNSGCYNYLEGYLNFYSKTLNSKNDDELEKNFDYAKRSLKLFTICWEKEREEQGQIDNIEDNKLNYE
jgi:hypothetical protein